MATKEPLASRHLHPRADTNSAGHKVTVPRSLRIAG